jgi:tRNA1Val (adenine37-N6)-methyltransferase
MVLGASINGNYQHILDIGTGTGVLALMAKQKNPSAKIIAIDIDEESLIDCKVNFENSIWKHDLNCALQDFSTYSSPHKFDCIVCNPPYYENGFLSESDSNNRAKHTLDFSLEALFQKAKSLLHPNGHFWVILPYATAEKWMDFGTSIGLFTSEQIVVFGKPDSPKRTILKMEIQDKKITNRFLTIRNQDNSYTNEYKELTKEFHNRTL